MIQRGRSAALLMAAALVALTAQENSAAERPSIASNQGVSLEASSPTVLLEDTAGVDPASTQLVGPPFGLVDSSQSAGSNDWVSSRAQRLQRGPDPDVLTSPLPSPWYRTGPGALGIVLALVGVLYMAARRWLPSAKAADTGALRVVARTSLTPRHAAALLQLGRRFVLVGVSPGRLQTLSEVADPDEVADLLIRTGLSKPSARSSFDAVLKTQAEEFGDGLRPDPEGNESPGFAMGHPCNGVGGLLRRLRSLTERGVQPGQVPIPVGLGAMSAAKRGHVDLP
jgi:flagellar biogenesis protein FliO